MSSMKNAFYWVHILLCVLPLWSEKVLIAPILLINEDGMQNSVEKPPHRELEERMHEYWFNGVVYFESVDDKIVETVQTMQQALQVCSAENADYLVYGYIRENGAYLFAELRVFNPGNQLRVSSQMTPAIIEKRVFAAAGFGEREKLLEQLACDLYEYFSIKYYLVPEEDPRKTSTFAVKLSITAGYWSFVTADWIELIMGTGQGALGLEIYPKADLPGTKRFRHNFSFRLDLGYRFGLGNPERYPAFFHEATAAVPVFYNMQFSGRHGLSIGLGPLYSFSFVYLQQKYEEPAWHLLNQYGARLYTDYRCEVNDRVAVAVGFTLDVYVSKTTMPVISPHLGLICTPYEKKEHRK